MREFRDVSIGIMCLVIACCAAWITLRLDTLTTNLDQGITEVREGVGVSLDEINKPRYGTIAMLNEDLFQMRLTIDGTNKVILHEQTQLGSYDALAGRLGTDLDRVAEKAGVAADSLSSTANAATAAVNTTNETIRGTQPLIASLTNTSDASANAIEAVNARVRDPRIDALIDNIRGMTMNGDGIIGDARLVADHETREFLRPVKWYMQPIKKGGDLVDILAAIARHTP